LNLSSLDDGTHRNGGDTLVYPRLVEKIRHDDHGEVDLEVASLNTLRPSNYYFAHKLAAQRTGLLRKKHA
jgi:hypothetical protein